MKKILIIEDERTLLQALEQKFQSEGYDVISAKNGEEGLDVALSHHPDLILLDIVMPKMDGLSMLEKLRDDEWGKTAQVIMLSNLSDAEKVESATKYDVHDYLVKSDWKIQDVLKKVKEKLGE